MNDILIIECLIHSLLIKEIYGGIIWAYLIKWRLKNILKLQIKF